MITKEDLVVFIEQAFAGVPQPEELTLYKAEAEDDFGMTADHHPPDFRGRWQDIPTEHIKACQNALSYLDKVGLRYYLPAYMVWYVQHLENVEEVYSDNTLYALNHHPTNAQLADYHKERFSLFNDLQLEACALFVKYCMQHPEYADETFAQEIYEQYWWQFDREFNS